MNARLTTQFTEDLLTLGIVPRPKKIEEKKLEELTAVELRFVLAEYQVRVTAH